MKNRWVSPATLVTEVVRSGRHPRLFSVQESLKSVPRSSMPPTTVMPSEDVAATSPLRASGSTALDSSVQAEPFQRQPSERTTPDAPTPPNTTTLPPVTSSAAPAYMRASGEVTAVLSDQLVPFHSYVWLLNVASASVVPPKSTTTWRLESYAMACP